MMVKMKTEIKKKKNAGKAGSQDRSQDGLLKLEAEVLRSTLVSRMDIHQTRIEFTQEETKVKMDIYQEKKEAAIHTIRCELDETVKNWVEDVQSYVD
jgi:hypothetical protein